MDNIKNIKQKIQSETTKFKSNSRNSQNLQKQAVKYLPGGSSRGTAFFEPYPTYFKKGSGKYVYDVDDNKYLDYMINATSLILGHSHPKVVKAIQDQTIQGTAFSGPTEPQIELAKILCNNIPSMDLIRFTNSGTESTMMAIRAARAYTKKTKLVKIEGGYHGSHEYVSISVYPKKSKMKNSNIESILEYEGQPQSLKNDVIVIPYNNIYEAEKVLLKNHKEIACLIIEPVLSQFGYLPAKIEYLKAIRDLTKKLNIVLIFDEIQSFRLSKSGAQGIMNISPDLTTLGKVIGGGTPIGAFGGSHEIMSLFDPTSDSFLQHSGTFNANPISMVAGKTVLENLTQSDYSRMNELGGMLRKSLSDLFFELNIEAKVTGIGSLFGVHFTNSKITDYTSIINSNLEINKYFFINLLNQGILIQSKFYGALNVLTDESDINTLLDKTKTAAKALL